MKLKILVYLFSALIALASNAEACSRVLCNDSKIAIVTGRSMDWPESTEPTLTVFPRGLSRDGGKVGEKVIEDKNAHKWISKYGSVVVALYGVGSADGVNEKGLGMHLLYLNAADFGKRDLSKAGLQASLLGQYFLDSAANVKEALVLLNNIQPLMAEVKGHRSNVHFAIEDATGDSAIIEYIEGRPVVHHGPQYKLMTNDPRYEEQLKLLAMQDFSKPSSEMMLPGNVNPRDRFQRAAYYSALLPKAKNVREAVAGVLAVVRNVSVPFGAPYKGFGIYNTEYRTVINHTDLTYFFELTNSPNLIWVDLKKFDFEKGANILILNPDNIDLSGDVSSQFLPVTKQLF